MTVVTLITERDNDDFSEIMGREQIKLVFFRKCIRRAGDMSRHNLFSTTTILCAIEVADMLCSAASWTRADIAAYLTDTEQNSRMFLGSIEIPAV